MSNEYKKELNGKFNNSINQLKQRNESTLMYIFSRKKIIWNE